MTTVPWPTHVRCTGCWRIGALRGWKCQNTSRSRKQTLTWYITCLVVNNIPWYCTNWTGFNSHKSSTYPLNFAKDSICGPIKWTFGIGNRASELLAFDYVRTQISDFANPKEVMTLHGWYADTFYITSMVNTYATYTYLNRTTQFHCNYFRYLESPFF